MSEAVTTKKKKKHPILWTLLLLPIILIGIGLALISSPKSAGVKYTDADFQSYLAKGGITFSEDRASIEDIFTGHYKAIGVRSVDVTLTSSEVTAILNHAAKDTGVLSNIQVKFLDNNKVQASATISSDLSLVYQLYPGAKEYETYINTLKGKTVLIKGTLSSNPANQFTANIDSAYIGSIPVPADQVNPYTKNLGSAMNDLLGKVPGLSIDVFSFDTNGLKFKGTIPQEIKGLAYN